MPDWWSAVESVLGLLITAVIAGLTFILSRATVKLSVATENLVEATTQLVKSSDTPRLAVGIRPEEKNPNHMLFWVANFGTGIAQNIKFNPDLNDKILKLNLFQLPTNFDGIGPAKNGIEFLVPNEQRTFYIGSLIVPSRESCYDALKKETFSIDVSYTDSSGKAYEETFQTPFNEFEGTRGESKSVAQQQLVHGLNRLVQGLNPLVPPLSDMLRDSHLKTGEGHDEEE